MATYQIENTERFKAAARDFFNRNGRDPNDLDKFAIIDQLKCDRIEALGDQLDRIEGMLIKLLEG